MVGLSEAYRSEYLRRVDESTRFLLKFAKKDLVIGAIVEWETAERTMEQMGEMGAAAEVDSARAILVGINVELFATESGDGVANSFGNAWIPRFSSVMQFHAPYDDAPNLSVLDGDEGYAFVPAR